MRKWRKGERIKSVVEVVEAIASDKPIFQGDKVQTSGWTQNWSAALIRRMLGSPGPFHAEPTGE